MPAPLHPQVEMVALDAFPLREPVSRRAYTCLRLRTRSGATGYGECSRLAAADLSALRAAIQGKEASSFQSIRRSLAVSASALAGLDMAMLDLLGKFTKAPVYQMLGGPTRNQGRALAPDRRGNGRGHYSGRVERTRGRPQSFSHSNPRDALAEPQRHAGECRAAEIGAGSRRGR